MPLPLAWRDLGKSRFPAIPADCGNEATPGVVEDADFRNWSERPTTADQRRIERYLDRFDLRDKRILHIGVGNSGLARRFHGRVAEIVGTTIDPPELEAAQSMSLPNYRVALHNKFSGDTDALQGKFDFIVDNNPNSSCCCMRHLAELFSLFATKLADGGQIVTDRQGIGWIPPSGLPRFRFDFDDFAAVATAAGFSTYRMNRTVYVLSRTRPAHAGAGALTRHFWRLARKLPGRLAHRGVRLAGRTFSMVRGAGRNFR